MSKLVDCALITDHPGSAERSLKDEEWYPGKDLRL